MRGNFLVFAFTIQIFCIFAPLQKPKGQAANILKERRCTNALSVAHKNLANSKSSAR